MRYWNRNLISTTKRSPTTSDASGIFDLTSQQVYKADSAWPALTNPFITTDGLYLFLDAGDSDSYPGSGNTWFDLTSNDLDFTRYNGTAYNSGFDGHFVFDGSNDYFEISSGWTSFGADPFTIEAWFRVHTTSQAEALVSTVGGGNGTFQLAQNNSGFLVLNATTTSGTSETVTATSALSLNTWQQTVMVREGTGTDQFKIYKNGSLDATGTLSANLNNTAQIRIGRNRNGGHYLDGDLSIIRIYKNKALSSAEVLGNYNNSRTRYSLPTAGVITNGLILLLDAGDSSSYGGSGTTWTDLSSYGNNGTLTNGPTFDSANEGSIVFDGSDDVVSISDSSSIDVTPTVTISAWINPSGFGENNFGRILDSDDSYNFFLDNVTVTSGIRYWPNAGNGLSVANCVTLNEWANFVAVHSGSSITIYKNGVSIGSTTGMSTLPSTSSGLTIGNSNVGDRAFEGKISQVLVYDTALTAAEVLTNYNALRSRYSLPAAGVITDSLILHLDAGNSSSYSGSGTTWTDLSGNSNNGTLTNGPTFDSNNQGSIVFDGTNDYVDLGTQINSDIANTDVTISFWAYIDSTANDEVFVAMSTLTTTRPLIIWYDTAVSSKNNTGTGDVGGGTTNAITVMVTSTGSNERRFATGNNVLTANTWHNIAVVLDVTNNAFYTYIDGVEQAKWVSDNSHAGIESSTNGFRIGGGTPYLDGRISQFLAYTKALSASEVLHNYNALKDRYS